MNNEENKNTPPRRGPHGGPPGMRTVEKAKDFKGTLKKLLYYMSDYKIGLITVVTI